METLGTVALRAWRVGDEEQIVSIANNRNIWRNLTDQFPHPYTHLDAVTWIEASRENPDDQRHFAVLIDDTLVGGAGFARLTDLNTRSAEIGYWIGEPWWGRGIAVQALLLATEIAFRDFDFERLQAGVLGWNKRSCRVLEKAGYTLDACLERAAFKDGEVCDQYLYSLVRPVTS